MKHIRIFLTLILILWSGLSAADTFQDILERGDQAEVAAHLAGLHDAHVAGDIPASGIRSAFAVFSTTAPHIRPFVEQWVEDDPRSPYANAAATWVHHGIAWRMRGGGTYQWTYPAAMEAFQTHLTLSQQHAWAAFEVAPDLIPATDALLMNEKVFGELGPFGVIDLVDRILQDTPNRGTIYEAASAFQQKWGGDPRNIIPLCETAADRLPTLEGYSAEVCTADVLLTNGGLNNDALERSIFVLREHGSARFDHHWMALYASGVAPNRFGMTLSDIVEVLMEGDVFDYSAAQRLYRGQFVSHPTVPIEFQAEATQIILAHKAHAQEALARDPGNLFIHSMAIFRTEDADDNAARPEIDERRDMMGHLLEAAPYMPNRWSDAIGLYRMRSENGYPISRPDLRANMIAYGNHHPNYLAWALRQDIGGRSTGETDAEGFDFDLYDEEVVCPSIRIGRLFDEVCTYMGDHWRCQRRARLDEIRATLMASATERGACRFEQTAPIEDLIYTPVDAQVGAYIHEAQ